MYSDVGPWSQPAIAQRLAEEEPYWDVIRKTIHAKERMETGKIHSPGQGRNQIVTKSWEHIFAEYGNDPSGTYHDDSDLHWERHCCRSSIGVAAFHLRGEPEEEPTESRIIAVEESNMFRSNQGYVPSQSLFSHLLFPLFS